MRRKTKSKTTRGSTYQPGAKTTTSQSDQLHMSANVAPGGYNTSQPTTNAIISGSSRAGGGAGYSNVNVSRTGARSATTTTSQPTQRSSYVTYSSTQYNTPSLGDLKPNKSPLPGVKSELVFTLGVALIVVSGLTNKHLNAVWDGLFNGDKMQYTKQQFRVGMVIIGGELIFLFVLTAISEASEDFANVALALLFALGLVWSVLNAKTTSGWVQFMLGESKKI
jgi:hypothetical protein